VTRFEDLECGIAVEDPWVWRFFFASCLSYVVFFSDAYPFDATITSENVVITILNICFSTITSENVVITILNICFSLYECLSGVITWVTVDINLSSLWEFNYA
jgi:hypothetical protein